jgi:c-di-GMP-binding flagellar brake protein YcgR
MERRKYRRASIIGLVEIRKDPEGSFTEAYAINISYGGLAVYSKNPLTGRVYVKLYFGDGTGKKIDETVVAQVVWQESVGSWYAVGLQFKGLNPQDHSMTLGFLKWSVGLEKGPTV